MLKWYCEGCERGIRNVFKLRYFCELSDNVTVFALGKYVRSGLNKPVTESNELRGQNFLNTIARWNNRLSGEHCVLVLMFRLRVIKVP